MQALVRVQARVRARRIHLSNEKLEKAMEEEEEELRELVKQEPPSTKPMSPMRRRSDFDNSWDDRRQSFQKIKENDLRKHEAAMKRERALAYAFNYQQVS